MADALPLCSYGAVCRNGRFGFVDTFEADKPMIINGTVIAILFNRCPGTALALADDTEAYDPGSYFANIYHRARICTIFATIIPISTARRRR